MELLLILLILYLIILIKKCIKKDGFMNGKNLPNSIKLFSNNGNDNKNINISCNNVSSPCIFKDYKYTFNNKVLVDNLLLFFNKKFKTNPNNYLTNSKFKLFKKI